jgi:anti-sigma factor RsiW
MSHERYEQLMMMAVDGVLAGEAAQELDTHLAECPSCRSELADFQLVKAATDNLRGRILHDARIPAIEATPLRRGALGLVYILLTAGFVLLMGYLTWIFFSDPTVPWPVATGVACGLIGGLALLYYVLASRMKTLKDDPYREIDQ